MKKNIRRMGVILSSAFMLAACGGGGGDDGGSANEDPNKVLTNSLNFSGGTVVQGQPPEPTFNPGDPVVQQGTGTTTVSAGSSSSLGVTVSQLPPNQDVQVNVQFGNSNSFIQIPVSQSTLGGATSGTLNLPFNVPQGICDNVDDIQHQIDCYEQVQLPDGSVVSKQAAQSMLLACGSGGGSGFNSASAFCADDYPKDACDILASNQGYGDWEYASGSSCSSAYPNAQSLGGYSCASSGVYSDCGACAIADTSTVQTSGSESKKLTAAAHSEEDRAAITAAIYEQLREYQYSAEARKRITFTPHPVE